MSNTQLQTTSQDALSIMPAASEWQMIISMADTLVKSGFLPKAIKTKEAAAAIILKGRDLSLPPMTAFGSIHVISGKPSCSSDLQLALLARGGVTWEWLKDGSDGEAVIQFKRKGFGDAFGRFTMAEAQTAEVIEVEYQGQNKSVKRTKLADKDTWKSYPANMLRARAVSNGSRMIGSDLLMGMIYTPEELGAEVDEDGTPLEIEGRKPVESPAKALQAPQNAPAPSGTTDTTAGQIVQPEPPQTASEGAIEESVDPDEREMAERAALILEIERLEGVFAFKPAQKTAMRTRDMGCADFDQATLDGLKQYCERMEAAGKTGSKTGAQQ